MNIAILEDDPVFASWMEREIRSHTHFPTALNTPEPAAMERYITGASSAGLYCLDLIVDRMTRGLAIANRIAAKEGADKVVFITAYPDILAGNHPYLTKAFSVISKHSPQVGSELAQTIDLARESLAAGRDVLQIGGKYQELYIPFPAICYLEHIKGTNKVGIHCFNARYMVWDTLNVLSERLDNRFTRCHHAFVANRDNIRRVDKRERLVFFADGSSCPYSYSRKGGLFQPR